MGSGIPTSPVVYENRDANGNVDARFEVSFTSPSPFPLTGIVAFNATGSGLTQIQVTRGDGTTVTFPLPATGKKVNVSTTDPQGLPTTLSMFTSSVSKTQINGQGFVNLGDIVGYTVF